MVERVAELRARLSSADRGARRHACDETVAKLQDQPELRAEIQSLLRDSNLELRFSACWILFRSGEGGLRLLPALLDSLELPDGDTRWSAAHMLATIGRMHPEVLPVLLHETREGRVALRRRMALYALRELAPEQDQTRDAFLLALDDADSSVQRAALSGFAKLGEPSSAAAERILEILEAHPDDRMRRIAAAVSAQVVGPNPEVLERARQALGALETSPDPVLSRTASAALTRLAS